MDSKIAAIAALIGERVRAKILWSLLDGKAYTATELSIFADASPQTTSMHLAKLTGAHLLKVECQGRHRYYRFANTEIAYVMEAMATLVSLENGENTPAKNSHSPVTYCRSCYDHLAGKVGVVLTEGLIHKNILLPGEKEFAVSPDGVDFFRNFNIDVNALRIQKRPLARQCLDWSERKSHLAGSLGAAMCNEFLSLDWMRRTKNSRVIVITAKGRQCLYEKLSVEV